MMTSCVGWRGWRGGAGAGAERRRDRSGEGATIGGSHRGVAGKLLQLVRAKPRLEAPEIVRGEPLTELGEHSREAAQRRLRPRERVDRRDRERLGIPRAAKAVN